MAPLIPLLAPLVPVIIKFAEQKITGTKKGKERKDLVVNTAAGAVKALRDSGVFEGNENIQDVANVVETVFQLMKTSGQLEEEKGAEPQEGQKIIIEGILKMV